MFSNALAKGRCFAHRNLLLCVALVFAGRLFAADPQTNSRSPKLVHNWQYIDFSTVSPDREPCPYNFYVHSGLQFGDVSRGLCLVILGVPPKPGYYKTNALAARLFRANGEMVDPTPEGRKELNIPLIFNTATPPPGMGNPAQVMTYFPWGTNGLEECWIEVSVEPEHYWLEIPYGFDRNPRDPLPPATHGGPPRIVAAMKSLTGHDRIIPWQDVHYDLGEIQNGWRLTVIQSNPFGATAEVELYKPPEQVSRSPWNLDTPHTAARIVCADGTVNHGRCIDRHLNDDYLRRTDTFALGAQGDDLRCWGRIEISVDDKAYQAVVPSSVYKFGHGHAANN